MDIVPLMNTGLSMILMSVMWVSKVREEVMIMIMGFER